ncbi:MAG: hypothetical protein HQL53_01725 [Magnetococcales bacterium]|nr:hypothetical protein [Magnetococcales bacterium]
MELLNLIPLAAIGWIFYLAIKDGLKRDYTDGYFQNKIKTGKKFCNWFGVPRAD